MSAVDMVDRALELLRAQDMAGFANLWALDGVMEFPFAAPGYPQRVAGREAVADYLRGYPDLLEIREFPTKVVHQSVDPDVVIVEFEAAGVVTATGDPYRMRYIAVITVRDGKIQNYRDYWSPLAAAEAMGGSGQVNSFGGVSGA
ncbi:nuclear transport factor 2 family protein [Mycolicibacterium thermoresistibile]